MSIYKGQFPIEFTGGAKQGEVTANSIYKGYDLVYGIASTPPFAGYRYWRYRVVSDVVVHHPRSSRIDLLDASDNEYNMITYVADNCADSGTIPSTPSNIDKDFGAGNFVNAVNAQCYNTYAGARRAANVEVYYSEDGISYTLAFSGTADSDARPSSPRCGLHTIL